MKNEIIEQSVAQYRQIARLNEEIEQALQVRDIEALILLCETTSELQEGVKANDRAVLDLLRHRPDLRESPQMRELLPLIQGIRDRNQRLTLQISGIMAVQRDELQKLNNGNTLLHGYHPAPHRTGKRISSAG